MKDKQFKYHQKSTGFNTPKGYFETFDEHVFSTNINKNTGFKSPEGYFNSIDEQVFNQLEHKDISHGFKTPDGYFDQLDHQIHEKLNQKTKVINLTQWLAVASVAACLMLWLNMYNPLQQDNAIDLEQISANDIDYWIQNEMITVDEDALIDEIDLDGMLAINLIDDAQIEAYLEDTEIEELINE